MPTYAQIYDMQENETLRHQVIVACRIAARDIAAEDANTPHHAARLAWAQRWIDGNNVVPLLERMLYVVCQNPAIQAAAPSGPFSDSDIQFVVNSNIDAQVVERVAVVGTPLLRMP
jgi:hypothetical protein